MSRPPISTRADYRWFTSMPTRWMDNDVYGHVNNVQYLPRPDHLRRPLRPPGIFLDPL